MKSPRKVNVEIHADTTALEQSLARINHHMRSIARTRARLRREIRRHDRRIARQRLYKRLAALPALYVLGVAVCGLAAALTIVYGR